MTQLRSLLAVHCSLFIVSLLLASCDRFNTPIYIKVPPLKPQLVVNSLFTPDSLWSVRVTSVKEPLASAENPLVPSTLAAISNAKVEIWENGNVLETLLPFPNGIYRSKTNRPKLGTAYKIRVSAPDFPTAEATATLPNMPNAAFTSQITRTSPNEQGFRQRKFNAAITLKWNDLNTLDENYMLTVFRRKTTIFSDSPTVLQSYEEGRFTSQSPYLGQSHDPINELAGEDYFWDAALFQDKLFNGQSAEIKLTLGGYTQSIRLTQGTTRQTDNIKQIVMFATLSPEMYRYEYNTQQQTNYGDSPFTEPVEIYSNIQNGKGIFAGYCAKYFVIE